MNPYFSRARRILLTVAASLLLTGCDLQSLFGPSDQSDQSGFDSLFGQSDQSDQPFPIDQGTIEEGTFTLSPDDVEAGLFSTTQPGTLTVTVDWGSAENSIELLLYPGNCTAADILENRLTGTCSDATLVAESDLPVVKPNVLTVPNLAASTYTLAIEYEGDPGTQPTETGTFSIVLNPLS